MRKASTMSRYEPPFEKQTSNRSSVANLAIHKTSTGQQRSGEFYDDYPVPPHTRYPPWKDTTTASDTPRQFTSSHIPANFHEYHFRSDFSAGQPSSSTGRLSGAADSVNTVFGQTSEAGPGDAGEDVVGGERAWEHTGLGSLLNTHKSDKTLMGDGIRFTIMSYNILAPGLQKKHPELYRNCSRESLDWNNRRHVLWQELVYYSPDIVCLQEVEVDQFYLFWEPKFSEYGFRGVYKRKTGDKEDGCAIFYHTSKFLLIDKLEVDCFQPHCPLLNRDNIGLLVKLESRNVPKRQKIIVGTTHLLFNPKRQDVRLAQVQLLLAELDRFAFSGYSKDGNSSYYPILMTGDFNSKPYSAVTKIFTDGQLKYMDENGELMKMLSRKRLNSLIPRSVGISDQCQHYKVLLQRYRRWKQQKTNHFEIDQKVQEYLVNIYPFVDTRNKSSSPTSEAQLLYPHGQMMQSVVDQRMQSEPHFPSTSGSRFGDYEAIKAKMPMGSLRPATFNPPTPGNSCANFEFPITPRNQSEFDEDVVDELTTCGVACDFESGYLSHSLKFRDIHAGKLDRRDGDAGSGVTTKQSGWICVDYIFQSMTYHPQFQKLVEGNLKLIRRLGLYTRNECKNKGEIPNEQHPSDHFPLVAEFLLRS